MQNVEGGRGAHGVTRLPVHFFILHSSFCLPLQRSAFGVAHGVVGAGVIAPEPAEDFGHFHAGLFATVRSNSPGVVDVVAFFGEGGDHFDVLGVPIAFGIVGGVGAAAAAEVVEAVLQIDADGFAVALADEVGVDVAAAEVGEAADGADDFVEL